MRADCPIFVISLAETPRRTECERMLNGLGLDFSFVNAVDGRLVKPRNPLLRFTRNLLYQTRFQIGRLQHELEYQPLKLGRRDGTIRNREERA